VMLLDAELYSDFLAGNVGCCLQSSAQATLSITDPNAFGQSHAHAPFLTQLFSALLINRASFFACISAMSFAIARNRETARDSSLQVRVRGQLRGLCLTRAVFGPHRHAFSLARFSRPTVTDFATSSLIHF